MPRCGRVVVVPPGFDVSALGRRERQVLELWRMGVPAEEMARILGTTPGAVKAAKHRLRERFRKFRSSAEYRRALKESKEELWSLLGDLGRKRRLRCGLALRPRG